MGPFQSTLMMAIIGMSLGELPLPERSYKILMLLPYSSKSHRNVFMPLAEGLADRGHKVVMLTSENKTSQHPNINELHHGLPDNYSLDFNAFEARQSMWVVIGQLLESVTNMTRALYQVPHLKQLYAERKEYDLIFIMYNVNEMMYPFLEDMPFITVVTFGKDQCQSAMMGNPFHPAYMNNIFLKLDLSNIFERLLNTFLLAPPILCWRDWFYLPAIQREIATLFPHLPLLHDIERNRSLTFMNSHFSMEMALPLLPSEIEIGGMHCRPGKPLPQNLKNWIEGAGPAGVVFFSLGSIVKGETMPVKYRDMFVATFKQLKQRVIWKFEIELDHISKNVMIQNWLPQQDILAHPNVKVFISHGGGLSTQESCYHGVPMLVLPLIADQPKNAELTAEAERGIYLKWEELTPELILNSLNEIINNPKYKENMAAVSRVIKDQPQTPLDRALFWTEYVIRHKGAPQLRSPAENLSWIEFLLLDVLSVVLLFLILIISIVYLFFRKIFRGIFARTDRKRKRE